MRGIPYALFSVAAWGTNYLAAGGVDSVAMSIAIATPLLFLMARFPPYRDAATCWASSASPASTYCSTPLWPTSQPPREPGNPVAGGGAGLAEARLPSRRRGGLPHPGAVAVRPRPLLATPTILNWAVYTVLMNRQASAVQPCRGPRRGSPSSDWPPCHIPPPSPCRKSWPTSSSSP
jgi:hypothetical protein